MDTLLRLDLALAHLEAHLFTGLRQVEPFSIGVPAIDDKLADYQAELTALCTRARAGEIERADFEREMEAIVNAALENFFLTGAETESIPADAVDQIGEEKYIALRSIRNLANDIYDGRYSEQKEDDEVTQTDEAGLLMLENRVSLWAGTAAGLYAMGMTFLEASQRLVWSYGGTIEHCFPAGTKIETEYGPKNIEDIQIGDRVHTLDGLKRVTRLFQKNYTGDMIDVEYQGKRVVSTSNHPFLTQRGWVRADELNELDYPVLFEYSNNTVERHVTFPNALNSIAAGCQVFILRGISFALCKLPFCQWFKTWVPVPVVAIGLNNKMVIDFDINNKFGLYQKIGFIRNIQTVKNSQKLLLKFGRIGFLNTLVALKQLEHYFFSFVWMLFVIALDFFYHLFSFHRIMFKHILASFGVDNSMRGFFSQANFDNIGPGENLLLGKSKFFSNLGRTFIGIMLAQVIIQFIGPYLVGRGLSSHMLIAIVAAPIGCMPTNWTGFRTNSYNSQAGIMSIPTPNRAKSISRIFDRLTTQFTSLHRYSAPQFHRIATLYHKSLTVYNLEVEDVHHYVANGFVVHNCNDCARLVGQVHTALEWRLSGWRPQSRALSCGGWKCLCLFRKTNKPKQGSF